MSRSKRTNLEFVSKLQFNFLMGILGMVRWIDGSIICWLVSWSVGRSSRLSVDRLRDWLVVGRLVG